VAVEGHPLSGGLASPAEVAAAGEHVRELVRDHFGLRQERGVSRLDVTTTRTFSVSAEARAFLAGMAALELPRCETTRRGTPAHSVAWTHASGRRILARCYDKGLERGGEAFEHVRLEDQGRFSSSGGRPTVERAAEASFQRDRLVRRFGPMAKAVRGVKAMTVPVLVKAIADEVQLGYRSPREGRDLIGSLLLFSAGVRPSRGDATLYRWRRRLAEEGFVAVEDWQEAAEVDLGRELEAALEEIGG
jgi:hypothetical protein